ncbi:hypothetical protein JX265_003736 [Neoarthrinium moseri]|uniref:Mediator of RNA polymerase II transcription subunit 4 n=1 Tax=Neoarthrinium moseri TaxID=1658444 RepID=A0A9P9WST8_9PEZI|nr:hypothetical protein JX265_003736 [Neoarthrinium moseri]
MELAAGVGEVVARHSLTRKKPAAPPQTPRQFEAVFSDELHGTPLDATCPLPRTASPSHKDTQATKDAQLHKSEDRRTSHVGAELPLSSQLRSHLLFLQKKAGGSLTCPHKLNLDAPSLSLSLLHVGAPDAAAMDKQISVRFERVEKALTTLIDSISKYNPSTNQGTELVTADAELSKGLEELQIHQQNYARIQHLHSITNSLDKQIKDTLTQLAQARKELVNTPATTFPSGPNYPIKYDELLDFARRISKTTLPHQSIIAAATAAQPAVSESVVKPDSGTNTAATTPGGTPNGASTPAQQVVGTTPGGATPAQNGEPPLASQQTNTSLPENITAHINPLERADFIPWPTEDLVRQGALANIAYLIEKGINPEGYDPAAEEERKKREEEAAKQEEERKRLERDEKERRYREQREKERIQREKEIEESYRRASVTQGPGAGPSASSPTGPPEKKQFQFMGGDDDDDSD